MHDEGTSTTAAAAVAGFFTISDFRLCISRVSNVAIVRPFFFSSEFLNSCLLKNNGCLRRNPIHAFDMKGYHAKKRGIGVPVSTAGGIPDVPDGSQSCRCNERRGSWEGESESITTEFPDKQPSRLRASLALRLFGWQSRFLIGLSPVIRLFRYFIRANILFSPTTLDRLIIIFEAMGTLLVPFALTHMRISCHQIHNVNP